MFNVKLASKSCSMGKRGMEKPILEVNGTSLNRTMILSFQNWALSHKKFSAVYKGFCKDTLEIIEESLSLLPHATPIAFHLWWSQHHTRFSHKKVDSREFRNMHMLMTQFLCFFIAEGRKGKNGRKDTVQTATKAEAKPEREHSSNRMQSTGKRKRKSRRGSI